MPGARDAEAPRILIAAGGTGGHVFPALFIAQAVKRLKPEAQIEFVGAGRPVEEKILGNAGFPRTVVHSAGIKSRGMRGVVDLLRTAPGACAELNRLFRRLRPHAVVGVGGFPSVLPVLVGSMRRARIWIHEAEIDPGLANRVLAPVADRISVAFADSKIGPKRKVVVTGHPVRDSLKVFFHAPIGDTPAPRKLLIMGGSQGARAIDLAAHELAPFFAEEGVEVWHQTRPENIEQLKSGYTAANVTAQTCTFIDKMEDAYQWADIIISRSGAGSVSELAIVNKPVIFVPLPAAGRSDPESNARVLSDRGKAVIVQQGDHFVERLREAITALLNPSAYRAMRQAPGVGGSADAADQIAAGLIALIDKRG